MNYDEYNREERQACCHLFRLLHEPSNNYLALRTFLSRETCSVDFRIYSEVALIRDAYYARKPQTHTFMDALTRVIMSQEGVSDCRLYSELPPELSNVSNTHPKQIREKAGDTLSSSESRVYGAMQGMFNAKPDLVICTANELIIYEAKLTLDFDHGQLYRTQNIGSVWSQLLFNDLGFATPPALSIKKLGLKKYAPDISWEQIMEIAAATYPPNDRSRIALSLAAKLGT